MQKWTIYLLILFIFIFSKESWCADWMNDIHGKHRISVLTIAGTHDSCALRGNWPGTICQSMTLTQQLEEGIRFLDIRCRHINNAFAIHHGMEYQEKNFGQVLQEIRDFLQKHPRECIIMSLKEEHTPYRTTRSFARTFVKRYTEGEYENLWFRETSIPRLHDARGKIVLLSRFNRSDVLEFGIDMHRWPDDESFTRTNNEKIRYHVQDEYSFVGHHLTEKKWKRISNWLEKAQEEENELWINFTSAALWYRTPRSLAEDIREKLIDYFKANSRDYLGIVVLDFCEKKSGLLKRIIKCNKSYKRS